MLQHLKLEIDHGTPARESSEETVTLEIDGDDGRACPRAPR